MQHMTSPHLDPRSPMVLNTRDLPRRPGATRVISRTVPAPDGLGLELIGVRVGADLALSLRLESVSEGVLVSGTVTVPAAGECGRCLLPINESLGVRVQELFVYEGSTTDSTTDEDEVGRMRGDLIDLEPVVRDAVVLALPSHPLCRDDCSGLCPDCGGRLDDLPADHSHQQVDARWAALSRLMTSEE